jgi:hypothetical protein
MTGCMAKWNYFVQAADSCCDDSEHAHQIHRLAEAASRGARADIWELQCCVVSDCTSKRSPFMIILCNK